MVKENGAQSVWWPRLGIGTLWSLKQEDGSETSLGHLVKSL